MKRNPIPAMSDIVSTMSYIGNSAPRHSGTMHVPVGGAVNMLSTNKDSSLVVVCGRNVLKLYSVDETCFTEKSNLRVGRRQGLSLSCADVAWNSVNENMIATAATNGHIVIWDLNLPGRNKLMTEFLDHNRTVNRINFHNSEQGLLLSGSQDCTMKMFDIRKKSSATTFASKNDGVRCVQFCPHEYFQFAASFDNGSVQFWDYRNLSTYLMQFIAHKGSVYSLEWHPDPKEKHRIATGGRDNKIKVWDMCDNTMFEHVVIPTHSLVAMARWRPHRKDQIASVAMMLDHSINVWDLRRPFVPFAHFTEHTDVTTGIVWKNGDPDILFSCSKDGTLYQHSMKDAARPAEHCNLSGLSLSCRGVLSYASSDNSSFVEHIPSAKKLGGGILFGFRNNVGVGPSQISESGLLVQNSHSTWAGSKMARFLNSKSDFSIYSYKNKANILQPSNLVSAAKSYKLQGMQFAELCQYNAAVAERLGMFRDACVWKYLDVLFKDCIPNICERNNSSSFHSGSLEKCSSKIGREVQKNGTLTTESNGDESDQHSDPETEHYLTDIARGNATSEQDCYYSEEEDILDEENFPGNIIPSDGDGFMPPPNWLPTEAIQRRFVYHGTPGLEVPADSNHGVEDDRLLTASPITIPEGRYESSEFDHTELLKKRSRKITSSAATYHSPPTNGALSVSPVVHLNPIQIPFIKLKKKAELLQNLFNDLLNNDTSIQIVTCAILILGHYCPSLHLSIVKDRIAHWQSVYLIFISKFELWNHYAEILNMSDLPSIRSLNSACVVHGCCSLCDRRLMCTDRWICPKHKDLDHKQAGLSSGVKCALCHKVIKSLYTWCQGCGHGGHADCMEEWFTFPHSKGRCPTGCGHICTRCL